MNVAGHQVRESLVDHAMPLQRIPAGECFRLDSNGKVPGAAACAGVAGMLRAVVPHRNLGWGECGFQSALDSGQSGFAHASQLARMPLPRDRAAIQNPCTMMKTIVSPNVPKNLKFTQVASSK